MPREPTALPIPAQCGLMSIDARTSAVTLYSASPLVNLTVPTIIGLEIPRMRSVGYRSRVVKEVELKRVAAPLAVVGVGVALLFSQPVASQDWTRREFPLAPPNSTGNFVAPYFDGYHPNEEGAKIIAEGLFRAISGGPGS